MLRDYMAQQPSLSAEMRAVLVDWLVEVQVSETRSGPARRSSTPNPTRVFQENFELFHETLYLAVKVTDHYLSTTPVHREMLQLVGSTAMLIASKFEVRSCPEPAGQLDAAA